jgi:hypothetical protein
MNISIIWKLSADENSNTRIKAIGAWIRYHVGRTFNTAATTTRTISEIKKII